MRADAIASMMILAHVHVCVFEGALVAVTLLLELLLVLMLVQLSRA